MHNKIPLIYILGSGRSGSTLLGLMLGKNPGYFNIGEAQNLPWELKKENKLCGCGISLNKCPFWKNIIAELDFENQDVPINYFREKPGAGKVLRWKYLKDIIFGKVSEKHKKKILKYGTNNYQYFSKVRNRAKELSGSDINRIIDVSKHSYRLFFLKQSDLFDIKVIHLIKNPCSFVYSSAVKNTQFTKIVEYKQVFKMSLRWLVENYIMLKLLENHFKKEDYIFITYKQLSTDPDTTIEAISNTLGENIEKNIKKFRNYENHIMSAGQMAYEDKGLHYDDKWANSMNKLYKLTTKAITWPVYNKILNKMKKNK